jgi:hypothetical protein
MSDVAMFERPLPQRIVRDRVEEGVATSELAERTPDVAECA